MKNLTPKISVILPIFNGEKHIEKTLKTILNQTYKNFELMIINDGSTDKTPEILSRIKDKRVKVINNKKNLGVTKSLNLGIKKARCKYIARCDSDDLNYPKRFEKQINFLEENPEYVLIGSNAKWINEKGKTLKGFKVKIEDRDIRRWMYIRNQFHHPSVMYKKSIFEKVGGYNEKFNGVEDYELWFRMMKFGKVYNLKENLIERRINEEGVTAKKHWKIEFLALVVRLINLKQLPQALL